jgi:small GTP-binding protein
MGNVFKILKQFVPVNDVRIVMVGLDSAGKTTILYKLKLGKNVFATPTLGFHVESILHKNTNFTFWDIGGQRTMRPLWKRYFMETKVLVFVLDSNDRDRIDEAHFELHRLDEEEELKDAILLVFANKMVRYSSIVGFFSNGFDAIYIFSPPNYRRTCPAQ